MQRTLQRSALALIVLVALTLRLTGLDWDAYEHYHPDERYINWVATSIDWPDDWSMALSPRTSSFNPFYWPPDAASDGIVVPQDQRRSFAYGHLPLYMGVAATRVAEWLGPGVRSLLPDEWVLVRDVFGAGELVEFNRIAAVGRALTALVDVGSVLLLFLLGRRLFSTAVGLLAAAFLAVSVLHVQLAHFFTVDPYLTFFVVGSLTALAYALPPPGDPQRGLRRRYLMLAAAGIGLAVGSKFAAVLLVLPLLFALSRGERNEFWRNGAMALAVAALVFAVTNPFALLDWECDVVTSEATLLGVVTIPETNWGSCYLKNVATQRGMVSGAADFGFARQYIGTTPYLYPVEMQMRWGLGWVLGVLAFAGFAWTAGRGMVALWQWLAGMRPVLADYGPDLVTRARIRDGELVLLAWTVPYFLTTGAFEVKFMRYMQPLIPLLLLYGAALLWQIRHPAVRYITTVTILGVTALYALAFVNIYEEPHPWIAASTWIHENVPTSSTIAVEQWDEPLPSSIWIDGDYYRSSRYGQAELTWLTGPDAADTPEKLGRNLARLAAADYAMIASNRVYGVVPRLPERYPLSSQVHAALFSGELGYTLVYVDGRWPDLMGTAYWPDPFAWPDLPMPPAVDEMVGDRLNGGRFDESFTVYDQPLVMVWANTGRLTPAEMNAVLEAAPRQR